MAQRHKIQIERGTYYHKHWLTLADGGSDEWLYAACDGLIYIFLKVDDLPAFCGRDATSRWTAEVSTVNLLDASESTLKGAFSCCGVDEPPDFKTVSGRLQLAQMIYEYGDKGVLWHDDAGEVSFDNWGNVENDYDENCPAFRTLRKQGREFAEGLFDEEHREHLLDTTIFNALGQTARERMQGNEAFSAKLIELAQSSERTPEQDLVVKLYQEADTLLDGRASPI